MFTETLYRTLGRRPIRGRRESSTGRSTSPELGAVPSLVKPTVELCLALLESEEGNEELAEINTIAGIRGVELDGSRGRRSSPLPEEMGLQVCRRRLLGSLNVFPSPKSLGSPWPGPPSSRLETKWGRRQPWKLSIRRRRGCRVFGKNRRITFLKQPRRRRGSDAAATPDAYASDLAAFPLSTLPLAHTGTRQMQWWRLEVGVVVRRRLALCQPQRSSRRLWWSGQRGREMKCSVVGEECGRVYCREAGLVLCWLKGYWVLLKRVQLLANPGG